jgi:hypothetical protein
MRASTFHRAGAIVLALAVAACSTPSQPYLDNARTMCASGHMGYCAAIRELQARVNTEQAQQAQNAAAILGAVAIGAAAVYGASRPVYTPPPSVVILCRWGC